MTDTESAHAVDTSDTAMPPATAKDPRDSDFAPVIRSKIQPPPLRSTTLTRQRLIDRLHDATQSRVTLLVAEAGYGKTTLLADFAARSGQRTLWYRLDPTDADPITWTNYLIAACREVVPEFGKATSGLLAQIGAAGPPDPVFIASVIDELRTLGEAPTTLVLDDFHAVDSSSEVKDMVERLVRDAPPWLHVVISTRRRPSLRFARLDAMGDLIQIGTDELRFDVDETRDLFSERFGTPLEPDVLQVVDLRTRGWAASLQLFYGSIRNKPISAARSLASMLSGAESPIYDFLAEEVLANIPAEVETMLVRASILDRVVPEHVVELLDNSRRPSAETVNGWIEEADHLGLLRRSSATSTARQLHPLLRDFLARRLHTQVGPGGIAEMRIRLARTLEHGHPLVAARQYLEAGRNHDAMRCLGGSVMHTMGSALWGDASDLIERLDGVPADAAVAAIQARRYIESGDFQRAHQILASADPKDASADVRAVYRHVKLSLGWRSGDRDLMVQTLNEIETDDETPPILRDIFKFWSVASLASPSSPTYTSLVTQLARMADEQSRAGFIYFSAIARHNAAVLSNAAGNTNDAVRFANEAIATFDRVPGLDHERYATHAALVMCFLELGDKSRADEHARLALSTGTEHGDVHADVAYAFALIGEQTRAVRLMESAAELGRIGRSEASADVLTSLSKAFIALPNSPISALAELDSFPRDLPLDTGYDLDAPTIAVVARLLLGEVDLARQELADVLLLARAKGSRRSESRLGLLQALVLGDGGALREALENAASIGQLAILTVADVLARNLWLVPEGPREIRASIAMWPSRWLPLLRRQLDEGGTANASAAALLLDEFGENQDVSRLRAFSKTYRRSVRMTHGLGRQLAHRVAPVLAIRDLGRTELAVGERSVSLGEMRRKSSSLLMYLVTRPSHSATRDQVLEELWPESDPEAAANSLNQALYYLRRDIDPWFEDEVSVDYVVFQTDLLWLEPALVRISSAEFARLARTPISDDPAAPAALSVLAMYRGRFCPEFEYEEWAIGWANRVHTMFLHFAGTSIRHYVDRNQLQEARDAAILALTHDPDAREIEQKLVWLYWREGAKSSAVAQHQHLVSLERADGVQPARLEELTGERMP